MVFVVTLRTIAFAVLIKVNEVVHLQLKRLLTVNLMKKSTR